MTSDLRSRYARILKERNIPAPSPAAYALLDAIEERITDEMRQVASNWQSHVFLDKRLKALETEDAV